MGFTHSTGDEIWYYIKIEYKNPKSLIISVIQNRRKHIDTYKCYTNEYPKQAPELNYMELFFLNSSNDIISGDLDEITPNHNKVLGGIEPEKKRNDSDMEISEDDGEDIDEDANNKSDVRLESGEHEGFDNDEPYLEETLPP